MKKKYVIVVEGTDGSGKSFIINNISPLLEEKYNAKVVYNHLRPNLLPDIGVILGKRKKPKESNKPIVVDNPHAGKQSGLLGSVMRWGYYLIDYTLGYFVKVFLNEESRLTIYIFDRYYYEYYIDQKRCRTNLSQCVIRFGELLVPSPDLILCLGGNPEKIYARKPETSLEEVSRQTKALKEFCAKRNNAIWVDTTTTPESSIKTALFACEKIIR